MRGIYLTIYISGMCRKYGISESRLAKIIQTINFTLPKFTTDFLLLLELSEVKYFIEIYRIHECSLSIPFGNDRSNIVYKHRSIP